VSGTFTVLAPEYTDMDDFAGRFERLGYSEKVEQAVFDSLRNKTALKWKGRPFVLKTIYDEDKDSTREEAPDKRRFLLPDAEGRLRYVYGYRGDGTDTGRRALPVEDCRMLLNIAGVKAGQKMLDPFAGGGGIVYAAVKAGLSVFSSDIDPRLQYGLRDYGSDHRVAPIEQLPFADGEFDAVITEAPFDNNSTDIVVDGIAEISRVLSPAGSFVMMAADHQAAKIRDQALKLGFKNFADRNLDRKGTSVHVFAWKKALC
jgi:SAM-dependent methyltransferase